LANFRNSQIEETQSTTIGQTEEKMRTKLFISLLVIVLLTATNPAPQFSADNAAWAENIAASIPQPMLMAFPGLTGMPIPTMTNASPGCLAPKGMHGPTAPFKIEVFGAKKANVNINGTSRNGNYVIYCSLVVKQGKPVTIDLMWGNYVYLVARSTKTSRGSFFINNFDKATMQVFKNKIKIGPYP
jgi:hypothetical protein